jgi:hypothetical protein
MMHLAGGPIEERLTSQAVKIKMQNGKGLFGFKDKA